jgi:hypothetical protein
MKACLIPEAFMPAPVLVRPTGRYAAGLARVPLWPGRRASLRSSGSVPACLASEAEAEAGHAIPSDKIQKF